MRSFIYKLFLCLFIVAALPLSLQGALHASPQQATATSNWVIDSHLKTRVLSEFDTIIPGRIYTLAIELEPEPQWHSVWAWPGTNQQQATNTRLAVQWRGPAGAYFDDTQWPALQRYYNSNLVSYGFAGRHYLLTDFSIPASESLSDKVTLSADLHWQLCHNSTADCVSGTSQHNITLNIAPSNQGNSPALELNRPHFTAARQQLPELAPWQARYDIQGEHLTLLIESAEAVNLVQAASDVSKVYAYIGAPDLIANNAKQNIEYVDDILVIRHPVEQVTNLPSSFLVQLALTDNLGTARTLEFLAEAVQPETVSTTTISQADTSLLLVFIFAFLGGLILNLMPCVFPVLSLKAMALANSNSSNSQRSESLWYTAGVVVSFLIIATTLIALRAAGQALGWGFQLQSPWLIGALVFLFVAIGLNLTGAFQIGTRLMGLGQQSSAFSNSSSGAQNSFATGVLAVLIASPCTAPFMGVALGYAIVQPPPLALLIFSVLGLGLAAPFLLLGFVPSFAKLLPKPGAWMDTFKQWMAVPMYITTVWLLWVFGRQTGIDSLTLLLLAAVLFATALWWWGKQQLKGKTSKLQTAIVLTFIALAALSFYQALQLPAANSGSSHLATDNETTWSQAKLDKLRNEQPVFVNMTADWCITCLANERVALYTDATKALFNEYNVAELKGDWTLQDSAITEYLAKFGRNGVPLYVLYFPGEEPQVLPQILTNRIMREYITGSTTNSD